MQITDSRRWSVRVLRGTAHGAAPTLLRTLLAPFGWVYGLLTRVRRWAFRAGLARTHRMDVPVISVGNLTVGGTGKTPMVEWLVRWLAENGRRPAVLSRGYGARTRGKNDEAMLLERHLPRVPHYVRADRVRAGDEARAGGADCLVLDDGFQHLRMGRDLDIVMIDATDPAGNGRMLPAGPLREPFSCVRNADALVLTRTDVAEESRLEKLRARVGALAPQAAPVTTAHHPKVLLLADGHEAESLDWLSGRRVYVFCGIGNPDGFLRTVARLSADIVGATFLPDHFSYGDEDLAALAAACERADAEVAVTTEKDAVKLVKAWPGPAPLRALRIAMVVTSGAERLEEMLRTALS